MPSLLHEALIDLCRRAPAMVVELLGDRLDLPSDGSVTFVPTETSLSQLTVLDADLVLRVHDARGTLRCALIIEVQLDCKPEKERAWPAYQSGVHRRLGCPTYVVVVTIHPEVAAWAMGPFETGQTSFRPWVIGPQHVPVITDCDRARAAVELTVLSGLAHHDAPEAKEIGETLIDVLGDHVLADLYLDLFLRTANEAARRALMIKLESFRPQSEWGKRIYLEGLREGEAVGEARGQARGEARGEARALLVLLEARGLLVDEATRSWVETTADGEQVRTWLRRAATATALRDVFDED